jgi:PAS domain S-box-containing protein
MLAVKSNLSRVSGFLMKKITIEDALTYLNQAIRILPGSIYLKDTNGVYSACNEFQAKMAGFDSPDQMIGKTDYDLPWKNNADEIRATDTRIMKSGIPEELIEHAILHDGTEIIMLSNKAPLYDDLGNIIGIAGTSIDITERKQAEERERAALEAVAAAETKRKVEEESKRVLMILAGSIAHDLRTPLACLSAINYGLKKYLPILKQYYDAAKKSGLEISEEIDERYIKRIENILKEPEDIARFIAEMHSFIDDNLKAIKHNDPNSLKEENLVECKSYKGIDNALESYPFNPGERELIDWDRYYYFEFLGNPMLFMRIVFNLLNNSLYQIHQNGKGRIFISSEEQSESNIIRFKDTAGGAPPEIVERIFDGYMTTKEKGTGVGLAFCKVTMESFGGSIKCHSVEGDFIEFVLSFPKIHAPQEES